MDRACIKRTDKIFSLIKSIMVTLWSTILLLALIDKPIKPTHTDIDFQNNCLYFLLYYATKCSYPCYLRLAIRRIKRMIRIKLAMSPITIFITLLHYASFSLSCVQTSSFYK